MDPVSVTATAATVAKTATAAYAFCEATYVFIRDAKVIDEGVRALNSEVKSCEDACTALRGLLEGLSDMGKALIEAQNSQCCSSIQHAMQDCGATVGELIAFANNIGEGKSTFYSGERYVHYPTQYSYLLWFLRS